LTPSGPRVAITGASGFVGSQLAERFERSGWSVVRFTRSAATASDLFVPFHLGEEVGDGALVLGVIAGGAQAVAGAAGGSARMAMA